MPCFVSCAVLFATGARPFNFTKFYARKKRFHPKITEDLQKSFRASYTITTQLPPPRVQLFFLKFCLGLLAMDSSKLTQMRAKASNTYRSNWQPRDASEVTLRHEQISQRNNSTTHRGPSQECCSDGARPVPRSISPTNGFSTSYSSEIVFERKAGCAQCNDPNFGTSGGVQLLTCSEVATILTNPENPIKGSSCYCADPGVKRQRGIVRSTNMIPSYTGWRNQVPARPRGTLASRILPPYPS